MKISADIQGQNGMPSGEQILEIDNIFDLDVKKDAVCEGFRLCKTQLNNLCCCCVNSDICKGSCLNIVTKGEAAVFVFTNSCKDCNDNRLFRQCKACGKRFNLFYLSGENNCNLQLDIGNRNKYLFIVLSKRFYKHLAKDHPGLFEPGNGLARQTFLPLLGSGKYFYYDICRVIDQIQNCPFRGDAVSLFMEAKILELLAFLMDSKHKRSSVEMQERVMGKIYKAKKILEKQYKKPPTIRELALLVGTNDTTLKRGFKELYNTTIYNYLLDYRMEKAKAMLSENKMSIQDISTTVGYERQANFATAFKRKFGVNPRQFRSNI